jgi:hypothetical protein
VTTSIADWKSVTDALGRTGKFGDSNTVYRIPLVRSDLQVVTVGVSIKPGLSLGGYVAFAKYDDATMVMGDLVVTEAELPKVTDALQSHGIEQTALHKHLLEQSPQVWWTHIHAMGESAKLAARVKAALDATAIAPAAAPPAQQPPVDLDTAGIDAALGRKGNPISLVTVHNHSLTDEPRLFYCITGPSMTSSRWPRRCGPRSMRRICNRRNDQCRGAGTPAAPPISAANLPEHQQRTECGTGVGVGVESIPRLVSSWLHVCAIPSDSQT